MAKYLQAPRSTNDATMVFLHFAGVGEAGKGLLEFGMFSVG